MSEKVRTFLFQQGDILLSRAESGQHQSVDHRPSAKPKEGNVALHRFTIFADYFQFIIQDENSKDDFGTLWNDDAVASMVAVGETSLSLGTLRNVDVAVAVLLLMDLLKFDWKTSTTQ
ncbi:hypothetical protein GTP81_16805 [Rugamonas sp. FT107W]|uniref:Uncharacterized protein n=1 Tax=Duganella vulcania TaxID=2692166 RepID=A0A845HGI9_9BURK|nr:hypothetical protein [Duganella vulcania]MYN18412.1 hypothetical protein [Duganella vulcania]